MAKSIIKHEYKKKEPSESIPK